MHTVTQCYYAQSMQTLPIPSWGGNLMPSDKLRLVIYTDAEKLDIIAKEQNRSRGNISETILKEYSANYEQEHGRINNPGVPVTKIG